MVLRVVASKIDYNKLIKMGGSNLYLARCAMEEGHTVHVHVAVHAARHSTLFRFFIRQLFYIEYIVNQMLLKPNNQKAYFML